MINRFWLPTTLRIAYLNDFLAVPVIAGFVLIGLKLYRPCIRRLDTFHILFIFLALTIVFEWYLPGKSPRYTSDVWDIAAYAAGSIAYFFINRKLH